MTTTRDRPRAKDLLFQAAAATLPWPIIERIARRALRGRHVAIVAHRVLRETRATDPDGETTTSPNELDVYIESMCRVARGGDADPHAAQGPAITVTFDDGYADAAAYVRSRAPRFPNVRFVFFVCPQKTKLRAGFRWDEYEESRKRGEAKPDDVDAFVTAPGDIATENTRDGLMGLADHPDYRLATVDECRALAALPNVALGNHSNCHFILSRLAPDDARRELAASIADFDALFGDVTGPCRHFAFSFGVPGRHFGDDHLQTLARLGNPTLWTVDERPHAPRMGGDRPGAIVPRLVFNGRYTARRMLLWTAWRATRRPAA